MVVGRAVAGVDHHRDRTGIRRRSSAPGGSAWPLRRASRAGPGRRWRSSAWAWRRGAPASRRRSTSVRTRRRRPRARGPTPRARACPWDTPAAPGCQILGERGGQGATTTVVSAAVRPKVSGTYISSARAGGVTRGGRGRGTGAPTARAGSRFRARRRSSPFRGRPSGDGEVFSTTRACATRTRREALSPRVSSLGEAVERPRRAVQGGAVPERALLEARELERGVELPARWRPADRPPAGAWPPGSGARRRGAARGPGHRGWRRG